VLYGQLRKYLGEVFHDLARQRESKVLEGHLQADHVHMMIAIPQKYAVSQVVGYLKGKSAIHIARNYLGQRKNYGGMSFWARGYFVSTVGTDEEVVRAYIREQEKEDQRVEQLTLLK
jgi:putative transposase